MISIFIAITVITAHLTMTSPAAQFTISRGDENGPSGRCGVIDYTPDAPSVVLTQFKNKMRGTLLDYFNDCRARYCGNTRPTHIVHHTHNSVRISVSARHVGLVEIWLNGDRVVQSDRLVDEYKVDFSQCEGDCVVRFIMAALHTFPAELYDNCVTVRTRGGGGSAPAPILGTGPSLVQQPVPVSVPVPPPVQPPNPVPLPLNNLGTTHPAPEWSCSADFTKLVRDVNGKVYEFVCAPGTKCSFIHNLPYPVCDHIPR
jgi:hypothetical protein